MEESRIKIGFTLTDHFGNEYSATSNVEVFEPLGERDLDVIGEQLNVFLRQIGYILLDYLYELRDADKNGGEEEDDGKQDA